MKVIFLDVDGVLNSEEFYEENKGELLVNPASIKALRQIVDATDARIVLTSTWRGGWRKGEENLDPYTMELVNALAAENLHIYDKTKIADNHSRAAEITDWILRTPHEIEGFVILDDNDSDFTEYKLHYHWIQTDFEKDGLTLVHTGPAVDILNHGGKLDGVARFFLSRKVKRVKFMNCGI